MPGGLLLNTQGKLRLILAVNWRGVAKMWEAVVQCLKEHSSSLSVSVPVTDRQDFQRSLTYDNLGRQLYLAWIIVFTMPVILAVEIKALSDVAAPTVYWIEWRNVAILRVLFIALAVVFLIYGRSPGSPAEINRRHRLCEIGFVVGSMIIAALMTGIGQPLKAALQVDLGLAPIPSVGAYIIAAFTCAAFLRLDGRVMSVYGISWVIVMVTLFQAQSNWAFGVPDMINTTFMTVLAILLSRARYAAGVKDFLQLRLIERQRCEVEKANALLAESNRHLRRLSFLDSMTGLPNRRYFDKYLGREWARAVREKTPLALVMLDIDHFKEFNDMYGHQAGDKCLTDIANCARAELKRPTDLFARYGGDEFMAVLPNTDSEGAALVARAIGRAVSALAISHAGSPHHLISVSVGIASRFPTSGDKLEVLVAEADAALYQAKLTGRNCFVCAS